jgi:hypothetical protein
MVTTPDAIEGPPTRRERVDGLVREVIAGDRRGAIRRIVLYGLTFGCLISPMPLAAVLPLCLLIATDQLL